MPKEAITREQAWEVYDWAKENGAHRLSGLYNGIGGWAVDLNDDPIVYNAVYNTDLGQVERTLYCSEKHLPDIEMNTSIRFTNETQRPR